MGKSERGMLQTNIGMNDAAITLLFQISERLNVLCDEFNTFFRTQQYPAISITAVGGNS